MLHTKKKERKEISLALCRTKIPHVCHQKEKKKRERGTGLSQKSQIKLGNRSI